MTCSSLLWPHHIVSSLVSSGFLFSSLLISFTGISDGADQVHARCGRRSEDHEEGERRKEEARDTITTQHTADTVVCISMCGAGKVKETCTRVLEYTYERTRKSVKGKT